MKDDPIVEEIRRVRSAHAARYGNDLDRIFAAIKESEKKSTAKLVNREPILHTARSAGFPRSSWCIDPNIHALHQMRGHQHVVVT